jgi:phosphoribosylpyrophosphate synthetase
MDSGTQSHGHELMSQARAQVKHLLQVACTLSRAETAVVVIVRDGTSSVLASLGAPTENATFRWPDNYMPYNPERTHVISDVADLQLARAVRAILGTYKTGMLVRVPVAVEPDYTLAMLLHASEPTPAPNKTELAVLKSIARGLEAELTELVREVLRSSAAPTAIPLSRLELAAEIHNEKGMRFLLDQQLNFVALSPAAIKLLLPDAQSGTVRTDQVFSSAFPTSIAHLFKRTLETGVSSPEVEVVINIAGLRKTVTVRASPVRPLNSQTDLLDISVHENGDHEVAMLSADHNFEHSKIAAGAAGSFLIDTLVRKRSIKDVDSIGYITVRAWRNAVKKHQIAALRAVKLHDPEAIAAFAGKECADEINTLVGNKVFKYVVPVPCGNSDPERCLSAAIARVIGAELGLPVIFAFANPDHPDALVPRKNGRRTKMRLIQQVPGPALLINDVASTGVTLAEAQKILNEAGTDAFAMAWIGGEVP